MENNSMQRFSMLNTLVTALIKIPKRILNPSVKTLTKFEAFIIHKILSRVTNEHDAMEIKNQLGLINYVDRGVSGNEYQSLLGRIEGLQTCIKFGKAISNISEHEFGRIAFSHNKKETNARIFCANGRIISLEFDRDVSELNSRFPFNPDSLDSSEFLG
jgi:hypothetical protein